MIRHNPVEAGSHILYFQHIHQEIGKFINILPQLLVFIVQSRIVKQFGVVIPDIAHTGSRRSNNRPVIREIMDEFFADYLGFIPETIVKGYLSATGLLRIIMNSYTKSLQNFYHIHGRFRVHLINKAGNKQINNHGGLN